VDIDVRMQLLGHKTEKTSRRYDHIDDDDLLEAAKKVEQRRGDRAKKSQVLAFRKVVND
jgi:integrase